MNAVTINHAKQDLEHLIGQVISDADPVIICKENGERAVLMSLDGFNSWQETMGDGRRTTDDRRFTEEET